jgi:lipopolysaccharide assembly protein A
MQFLKTLFWVVIAVFLAILGSRNWHDVTMNLWGDIQVDIKLPFLVIILFLIGWLPTYLLFRAKLWRVRTRLDSFERQQAAAQPIAPAPVAIEEDVLS